MNGTSGIAGTQKPNEAAHQLTAEAAGITYVDYYLEPDPYPAAQLARVIAEGATRPSGFTNRYYDVMRHQAEGGGQFTIPPAMKERIRAAAARDAAFIASKIIAATDGLTELRQVDFLIRSLGDAADLAKQPVKAFIDSTAITAARTAALDNARQIQVTAEAERIIRGASDGLRALLRREGFDQNLALSLLHAGAGVCVDSSRQGIRDLLAGAQQLTTTKV